MAKPKTSRMPAMGTAALVVSIVITFLCVLAVGTLISFVQFQTRMLGIDTKTGAELIVNMAELSVEIRREKEVYDTIEKASDIAEAEYRSLEKQVYQLSNLVCRSILFNPATGTANAAADQASYKGCLSLVSGVPYSLPPALLAGATPDLQGSGQPTTIDDARSINPVPSIYKLLNVPQEKVTVFKPYETLIGQISELNEKIYKKHYSAYFDNYYRKYNSCKKLLRLANQVEVYRTFQVGDCTSVLASQISIISSPEQIAAFSLYPVKAAAGKAAVIGGDGVDATVATAATGQSESDPEPAAAALQTESSSGGPQGTIDAAQLDSLKNIEDTVKADIFELASQYIFYNGVTFGILKHILIAPPEFLIFMIVSIGGVLGAFLQIITSAEETGRNPPWRRIAVLPIIGMICALITYVLFRSGFFLISTQDPTTPTSNISPFILSILALSAGFLSDEAIETFRRITGGWFKADIRQYYAYGLRAALAEAKLEPQEFAKRLGVEVNKLEAWMNESEPVPQRDREDIMLILEGDSRRVFTAQPPPDVGHGDAIPATGGTP